MAKKRKEKKKHKLFQEQRAAEEPRWMLGDAGGGGGGKATGTGCCRDHVSDRAQLVNLDVRERAADSLFSSARVWRRRRDVRRMRATPRVSDTPRQLRLRGGGWCFSRNMCARVSRRFPHGSRGVTKEPETEAMERVKERQRTRKEIAHETSQRRG